jgi:hypothetical protein
LRDSCPFIFAGKKGAVTIYVDATGNQLNKNAGGVRATGEVAANAIFERRSKIGANFEAHAKGEATKLRKAMESRAALIVKGRAEEAAFEQQQVARKALVAREAAEFWARLAAARRG